MDKGNDNKFSFFRSFKNVDVFTDKEIFLGIKSGKWKKQVDKYRNALLIDDNVNNLKNQLPSFATSGVFEGSHTAKNLVKYSRVIGLDFDKVDDVDKLKKKVIRLEYTYAAFVSPSENGLKVFVKLNTEAKDHIKVYKKVLEYYELLTGLKADEKCINISRLCFVSYDPDLYFNKKSKVYDISLNKKDGEILSSKIKISESTSIDEYYEKMIDLKEVLDQRMTFEEGNRNQYIAELSGKFNRYAIPKKIALNFLLDFVEPGFTESEITRTVKSIYNNKNWNGIETPQHDFKNKKTALLPISGFPKPLQDFINEYVNVYNTPRDYISASVLFSIAFAIGDKLELKGKYDNIPILWLALVGNVSSGKTDPLMKCLNYFSKKDNQSFKEYITDKKVYNEFSKNDKGSMPEPKYFQYILTDYTPEALYKVHTVNRRGLCIYRDELKGWFDDFNRYSKSGEETNMLSTFYRTPIKINRSSQDPLQINNPSIFIAGGIQADLVSELAKNNRAENGFMSRFIFAFPDDSSKSYRNNKILRPEVLKQFHDYLDALVNLPETINLKLSTEAENIYTNWFNKNADEVNLTLSGYLKGVYGKFDVICLRLAVVLHGMDLAVNNNTSSEINQENMRSAVEVTEYFRTTALKVYNKIFKDKPNSDINKKDVIRFLHGDGHSQNHIAKIMNLSQPYINKVLNNK